MKFSSLSIAFFAAVAAKSVGASDASASSLRGRGYDQDSSIMTPTRLLNVPELPSAAQDNAKADGKAQGGLFAGASETPSASPSAKPSATLSASPSAKPSDKPSPSPSATPSESPCDGCCWKLDQPYCSNISGNCITFDTCPTPDAVGTIIGVIEIGGTSYPITLNSISSDKEISMDFTSAIVTISDDGNTLTYGSVTLTIAS